MMESMPMPSSQSQREKTPEEENARRRDRMVDFVSRNVVGEVIKQKALNGEVFDVFERGIEVEIAQVARGMVESGDAEFVADEEDINLAVNRAIKEMREKEMREKEMREKEMREKKRIETLMDVVVEQAEENVRNVTLKLTSAEFDSLSQEEKRKRVFAEAVRVADEREVAVNEDQIKQVVEQYYPLEKN